MATLAKVETEIESIFRRRIDFHLARKTFNGFSTSNKNGFKLVTLNPNTPDYYTISSSSKEPEEPELPEPLLETELYFGITISRVGAGLRNLGNTCFLNSVLQCMTYTEPLAAYLQSGKHQSPCRAIGFCSLCAIQKHVNLALPSTGKVLEPKELVSNLRCISRDFQNARQEDAHEYLVNLLASMHKCCLPSSVPSESASAYEKSSIYKIFGGKLRSQVKCTKCSFCVDKFDNFLDLSLEIVKAESLKKVLANFTAKDFVNGDQCQQCKQNGKGLKQVTIYQPPNVLAIHMKRFGSNVKNDKNIAFGTTLDLERFVTGLHDGDLKYTLYGVIVHTGWTVHSGHYFCFVRTSTGMWFCLDDNQVTQVSEKKVLEQKAYMLFYLRDGKKAGLKKPVVNSTEKSTMFSSITPSISEKSIVQEIVSGDCKTDSKQTDMINVLTRGLEKTTVPGWNGTDVSFLEKVEPEEVKDVHIGYVGDEWDEEYDRGHTKKIRTNDIVFGGPNLFQEIASGKSKKRKGSNQFKSGAKKHRPRK